MKNLTAQAVYNADIYLRLSDDDGDKPESNSIKNQREFITEFLKSMPEIRIHAERKDDGFSGVDFFRPGIQEVLQDVRSGAVNCVVVKDLSRLGRNYIETGKVLQEFADHGIRFIAINDGYDTANLQGQASTILLPIKNLMKNISHSGKVSNDFSLFRRFCCINRCFRCSCGKFSIVHGVQAAIGFQAVAIGEKGDLPETHPVQPRTESKRPCRLTRAKPASKGSDRALSV